LKAVMDLYKVSRYRPAPLGNYLSDDTSAVRVGRSALADRTPKDGRNKAREADARPGNRDGEVGNIYHLFEKKAGAPSDKVSSDPFPIVRWVSVENGGRTVDDDMEDKAANFLQSQNTLLINADFRVFKDMIARLCKAKEPGAVPT